MPQGKVKFFNTEKGYGFIQPDDGGSDVFIHQSALDKACIRTLQTDQKINYDLEEDRKNKKLKAANIYLI